MIHAQVMNYKTKHLLCTITLPPLTRWVEGLEMGQSDPHFIPSPLNKNKVIKLELNNNLPNMIYE